jgi:hypothetical protein
MKSERIVSIQGSVTLVHKRIIKNKHKANSQKMIPAAMHPCHPTDIKTGISVQVNKRAQQVNST